MPEGPTIVIATEELARFRNKVILEVDGNTKTDKERLVGEKILDIFSYGKYLNFQFKDFAFRIHFMLFGSYRINEYRENMAPRLTLQVKGEYANFYNCSIKFFEESDIRSTYNYATDIMSDLWDKKAVMAKIKDCPDVTIDDVLMDQTIFTGVGNIIKNEVLFRQRLLPSTVVGELSSKKLSALVDDTRAYSHLFYELKKKYILKKSYQIYRKSQCPVCGGKVVHTKTGKRQRMSHFCPVCQK